MEPVWHDPRVRAGMARQAAAWPADVPGWKVALAAPAAQQQVGISGPVAGFLTEPRPSGAILPVDDWTAAAIEPEIAVHLGADLPAGASRDETRAAIGGLGLAIEVVDLDAGLDDLEAVIAGNIFHRAVVLGLPDPQARPEDVRIAVVLDGDEVAATDDPQAATGDLLDLTAHVATYLAAFGGRLQAGQVVIAGSVVPPVAIVPGRRLRVDGGRLGVLQLRF